MYEFTDIIERRTDRRPAVNEKLVPFDLEEARKDPSRVRHSSGFTPTALLFGDRHVAVQWCETDKYYVYCTESPGWTPKLLSLVAKPVEHRLHARQYHGSVWGYPTKVTDSVAVPVKPTAVRLEPDGTIVITE